MKRFINTSMEGRPLVRGEIFPPHQEKKAREMVHAWIDIEVLMTKRKGISWLSSRPDKFQKLQSLVEEEAWKFGKEKKYGVWSCRK